MICTLFTLAACSDDKKDPVEPEIPPTPLPELAMPKDPVVSVRQARVVVVEWVGDETATSYEVEMAGQTVELEGTSCGMYVKADTEYTWRVRAIRGEETTGWVVGPPFKTLVYDDPRIDWLGQWKVGEWKLTADVGGVAISLDEQIQELLPEEILNAIQNTIRFTLTAPEEESGIPGYDELIITLDMLEEFGFPTSAAVFLNDGMFGVERYMSYPLDYPGLPLDISEIPFLRNITGLSDIEDLMIKKLQVELTELQLSGGPVEGGMMPFTGILIGGISIETDDAMINMSLGFLKPKLRLTFTTTVERVEVVPGG